MFRGVFVGLVISAAVGLVGAGGAAAAPPPAGGCDAFGAFMGWSAPYSAQAQHPLGQAVREVTPFGPTLEQYKSSLCG
jgi:hypothetical protein